MSVRLRHVATINPSTPEFELLPDTAELPFLPLEAVWPGDRLDTTRRQPKAAVSTGYTRFREGDILLPKITPTFQADRTVIAVGIEGGVGAGTTELHVVRAGPDADVRYLCYLLSSKKFLDEGEASMVGVAGQKRVPDACLRDLRVPVVDLRHQRAIADYLDRETARIDALIEKKGKLVSVLQSRVETVVENHVRQLVEEYGSTPLKYAVRRVEVGIVITPSVWYGDEGGVPALRGLNVQPGRIDVTDLVYLTEEGHEVHRKSVLRQGDVVVVRTGQAGAAAVVPSELDGCNCIDLVIVRPSPDLVPQFLEYVLNSDWTQKHVEEYSVGTIQSHFNVGAMKQVPIPLPPLGRQAEEVEKLGTERAAIEELKECLTRQIDLLTEHRQALITAAVTGELEIPGVAA